MEQQSTLPHQRLNSTVRISTRFNNVLFPLDLRYLSQELVKNGYVLLSPPLPEQTPGQNAMIGGSFSPYARKGNSVVDIDTTHQHLGIKDINTPITYERFRELDNIAKGVYLGGKSLKIWFTEYQSSFKIKIKENTWKLIDKKFRSQGIAELLNDFLGAEVGVSQIKFSWPKERPDITNYFELLITPTLVDDHLLDFTIIFRYSNAKTFAEQVSKIDSYSENIISWLES